jgi:hypothetical protein
MKREAAGWGYNWATLILGDINIVTWPSKLGLGLKVENLTYRKILFCKVLRFYSGNYGECRFLGCGAA